MKWNIRNDQTLYGFHRGYLAGFEGEDRAKRQQRGLAWHYGPKPRRYLEVPNLEHDAAYRRTCANTSASPDASLEEALCGATLSSLRHAAKELGIKKMSTAPKEELVKRLLRATPLDLKRFECLLASTDDETFETLVTVLSGKQVTHQETRSRHNVPDLLPFAFASQEGSSCITFMPPELQEAFQGIDVGRIARKRNLKAEVISDVHTYVTLCGAATVDEVFSCFQLHTKLEGVTREDFDQAVQSITTYPQCLFTLIEEDGRTYLAHGSISAGLGPHFHDRWMDERASRRHYTPDRNASSDRERWEELLKRHGGIMARPSGNAPIGDVAQFIYGLPCVRALSSYFDCHVPYDEDEYTFSDFMVDLLIYLFMVRGCSLISVLGWLTRTGWSLSEGTNSAPRLTKLICDLSRQLPRWEYNGWSEEEYLDLMDLPAIISDTQDFDGAWPDISSDMSDFKDMLLAS